MDLTLRIAVLALSIFTVGLHGWAGKGHFASERLPRGAMLLALAVAACTITLVALLFAEPPNTVALATGFVVEALSLTLFYWAMQASRAARLLLAFDEKLPHTLLKGGPYRFVRHPFYTSYILFWTGWSLAVWSVWALPIWLLMLAVYVGAALGEEAKFARTHLSEDYAAYRARAGMFWPVRLGK